MNISIPEEPILKELAAASIRLARGAGAVLQHYQPGGTRVDYKGKGATDPVTEAGRGQDRAASFWPRRQKVGRPSPQPARIRTATSRTGTASAPPASGARRRWSRDGSRSPLS